MITPAMQTYLEEMRIPVRLSCVTENGWPVVLSLWYTYLDGAIYCATQTHAKVVSYLRHEPRCGFEIAADEPPYKGIRGHALAMLEPERGAEILDRLLLRYLGSLDVPLAVKLRQKAAAEVAIRLQPVKVFQWDYEKRMASSIVRKP